MASWAVSVSPVVTTVLAAVHVVDPRSLLIPDQGSGLSSVQLDLPQALLRSVPHFELGDADDPMSSWIFGKRAEIFQYKFVGGTLPAMLPCLCQCRHGLPTTKIWHQCSSLHPQLHSVIDHHALKRHILSTLQPVFIPASDLVVARSIETPEQR